MAPAPQAYLLHACAIFLSAFLLFQIQPIAAKHLLPYFGGASGVWATSMLFFTTLLFVGYAYVYFLSNRSYTQQTYIHRSLIVISVVVVVGGLLMWGTIYPPLGWTIASPLPPYILTLLALFTSIGIPYFLLSTTGPLIQYWYGMTHGREPYKLYALSNIGSLLALISYPFFVEPSIRLKHQDILWAALFLVFVAGCFYISTRFSKTKASAQSEAYTAPPSYGRIFAWIFYAAFPAFLLVATTTQITQVIAPVPLLWVVPLTLYLLTFIIAFSGIRLGFFVPIILIGAASASYYFLDYTSSYIIWKVAAYLALLFLAGLHAHTELYDLRPATTRLTLFYLFVSLGGMLGTLIASVIAPITLNNYWEFPIGIAVAAIIALYALARTVEMWLPKWIALIFAYGGLFAIGIAASHYVRAIDSDYIYLTRNFYGTAKVYEGDTYRSLMNGTTLHGSQSTEPGREGEPTTYYLAGSGVARAFDYARAMRKKEPIRVGIIGLGAGVIAAHCKDEDAFVFYEIDRRIEDVARTYFSFLARCKNSDVHIGDGRVVLDREFREKGSAKYDVIAVDAFSDDAIPTHLLTQESIRTYIKHLRDSHGVLAIHISNRYLDLLPVLMRVAQEEGLSLIPVDHDGGEGILASGSSWVLLSPGQDTFAAPAFKGAASELSTRKVKLWTDDHTDIISILDLPN